MAPCCCRCFRTRRPDRRPSRACPWPRRDFPGQMAQGNVRAGVGSDQYVVACQGAPPCSSSAALAEDVGDRGETSVGIMIDLVIIECDHNSIGWGEHIATEPGESGRGIRPHPRGEPNRRGAPAVVDRYEVDRIRTRECGRAVAGHAVRGRVLDEPRSTERIAEIHWSHRQPTFRGRTTQV